MKRLLVTCVAVLAATMLSAPVRAESNDANAANAAFTARANELASDILRRLHVTNAPPITTNAVGTFYAAKEIYDAGRYEECRRILDAFWKRYPMGSKAWDPVSWTDEAHLIGHPHAYVALQMLTECCRARTSPDWYKDAPVPLQWTIVLMGKIVATNGTTTFDERLVANDKRRLRRSMPLFLEYVKAMTKGRIEVQPRIIHLPDYAVPVSEADENGERGLDCDKVVADVPKEIRDTSEWWWLIYPLRPKYSPGGGMGGVNDGPCFLCEDGWVVGFDILEHPDRLREDEEYDLYFSQWLQHEFYHFVFGLYPECELEKEDHQWFDLTTWPVDFAKAQFESDYYSEALHKRIQAQATVPLHLKFKPKGTWKAEREAAGKNNADPKMGAEQWAVFGASSTSAPAGEPSLTTVEQQFRELPMAAKCLTGPLFWLHGDESKDRLELYIEKVAESGNGCFTSESRPHQDWLGEGWYRDLDICLQAARKHDLKMWIFDDVWWPSQTLGGNVPERYSVKRLAADAVAVEGPAPFHAEGHSGECYIATLAGKLDASGKIEGDSIVDLNDYITAGKLSWLAPSGRWQVMKFTYTRVPGSVDGASRDCTDWFIQKVYQPHFDRFGKDFGKTIPGFFYDEPETRGDWGTELNATLKEWNVDWKKAYVAYKFGLAGEADVAARYQYLDAFAETWGRVMYGGMADWCQQRKVISMGHFMEHGYLYVNRDYCAGDMMRLQKYSDMGGLDLVGQQMNPGTRPHDIYQTPKLASSITHVFDKKDDITMCEMFGAYGQDITYPQMKWLTDQMQVRGVNFMIPHSFNPRAPFDQDCPPYFYNGGFEPRYPLYRVYADYTSRLSLLLSGGRHVCPIALLFSGTSKQVGNMVTPEDMTSAIQDSLYDCDWLPFEVFEGKAELRGREVALNRERYQVLVVPPVEVIPFGILAKVKRFFDQGGIVVGYGFLPTKSATMGKTSADIATLCKAIWGGAPAPGTAACNRNDQGGKSYLLPEKPSSAELTQVLAKDAGLPPALEVVEGETGNWLHVLRRVKSGCDVFLVCNQNNEGSARKFKFRTAAQGIPEAWDAMRNELTSVTCQRTGNTTEFSLALEPMESVLLVFQSSARGLPPSAGATPPKREFPLRDASPKANKTVPRFVVVKATYGVPGDPNRTRDVRERLQTLIDAGERRLTVARLADGDDPADGVVKTLVAECTAGDHRLTLTGTDQQTLTLGAPSLLDQELSRLAAGRAYTDSPVAADPFEAACTLPVDLDLTKSRVYLEVDSLTPEEAACITVNGTYAGGFIGKPLRLDVTKHLKTGPNTIRMDPFSPKSARLVAY